MNDRIKSVLRMWRIVGVCVMLCVSGWGIMPTADFAAAASSQDLGGGLLLTGVFDGPLDGGTPKGIELYAAIEIEDLSRYGVGSANNGGGSDGQELTLSGSAVAGQFLYITNDLDGFRTFFGFDPDFVSNHATINGDDAVELFFDGGVIDTFGEIDQDGTGRPWEFTDGWGYRQSGTTVTGSAFQLNDWAFSGINQLDGATDNRSASTPFPIGSYVPSNSPPPPPEDPTPTATPLPNDLPALIINEILADPAADEAGDANGDGTRHTSEDEFIEIVNLSPDAADLAGWTIADGASVRHVFPEGTRLAPGCGLVLFGGGTPTGDFGQMPVQTASSGSLSLNNGGDTVYLNRPDGVGSEIELVYDGEAGQDQSLTRSPDLGPLPMVQHTAVADGARFSPGTRSNGTAFVGCETPSPDPTPTHTPMPTETPLDPQPTSEASCHGLPATIMVLDGKIVGGPLDGRNFLSVLRGTSGDDVIVGTDQYDNILAGGGNDVICAGGDGDYVRGGPGDDLIFGGDGRDRLMGQQGQDRIYGEAGDDGLYGGSESDYLDGGDGRDKLIGGAGHDTADGGAEATDTCRAEVETDCEW